MKVYLLDDDDIFNYLHESVIKSIVPQAQFFIFKSGLEFISSLQEKAAFYPEPDFIFLDIRMPDMDGFTLLEEMENLPEHPFLKAKVYILSSTLDERDLEKARSFARVADFIGKPLTIELCSKLFSV